MLSFVDALEDMFDKNKVNSSDIVAGRLFVMNQTPEQAMHHVIDKILPWKIQIDERNENFFRINMEIFGKLPEERVKYFADVVTNTLSEDDKNEIWDFLSVFVAFGEEHKKRK